jgi:hypothetical protein
MKPLTKLVSNKLLTRSALALVTTFSVLSTKADTEPSAYAMSVLVDSSGGRAVLRGDYDRVIADLAASTPISGTNFAAHTSLCVAYTKSEDFSNAENACNTAVAVTKKAIEGTRRGFSKRSLRRDLAMALSNRGVLRVVTGVTELAEQDFLEASELESGLLEPRANLSLIAELSGL